MPRPHFIKVFPGNETNLRWVKQRSRSPASRTAAALDALPRRPILEEQQKLLDLQTAHRHSAARI